MELLSKAIPATTFVFVVSSMLALGLNLTVGQVLAPLRNIKLVCLALLANFVLMPFGAFGIEKLLRLDQSLGVGLVLLGTAAGAPFLPKLAQIAKTDLAFAVALMVLLMIVTIGYMPLVLPLLIEGASVDPVKIARSLVLLMLLPLAVGLAMKASYQVAAARVKPVLDRVSNLSLILLTVLIWVTNFDKVLAIFGTRGILAGVLFTVLALGAGHLLGGPSGDSRRVLALGTAQRNIAAALLVGEQTFSDPKVVVMVIVVADVGLIILLLFARRLANQKQRTGVIPL
ncbi:MAG TPA: bile acid:sodium symporter [Terriglobales bacterium]|jgi:BASS family bile acid:Na+ symporter|nr:bile acid:sodium symporter [Terriglobales bacterium]